jgi:addiction module HigA family antidote
MLNAATMLPAQRVPPGDRLEGLHGDLEGRHSIRVSDPWRIVLRWTPLGSGRVSRVDDHSTGVPLLPEHRVPTHPGEILLREFLDPLGVTQVHLAAHIGVSVQRVNELVRGKRGVTSETAWLLAGAFGTTPEFWVQIQSQQDLARSRPTQSIRRLGKAR